jgi:hypothetical protein
MLLVNNPNRVTALFDCDPHSVTAKLVRRYFAGTLPENGMICDRSYTFFPDPQADPTFAIALDAEDVKLLNSARAVGELLRNVRWV